MKVKKAWALCPQEKCAANECDTVMEIYIPQKNIYKNGKAKQWNDGDELRCPVCGEETVVCDPHEGCYAYPNCDIDPNGCCVDNDDPEPYGMR